MLMNKYRPSFYNFIQEDETGGQIIYNTKTGAIDLIEPESVNIVNNILNGVDCGDSSQELISMMHEQGYLVDSQKDELKDIIEWNKNANNAENIAYLTILPTETCNFACPYCFIYKFRDHHMLPETYNAIFKYCENFFELNKSKEYALLEISWFGGEPTLMAENIIEFMKKLMELSKNYLNCVVNSIIITNGYLMDYNLFQRLLDVNIRRFQVTLDGDAENHDKLRVLKDKSPTFDKIYNNMVQIKKKVSPEENFKFTIRGNFLQSSIKNCENLMNLFVRDFADDQRFDIYFRPVYNFETDRDSINDLEKDLCIGDESVRMQNKLSFISMGKTNNQNRLEKISNPLPQPTHSWCTSICKNAHIIGYDGTIFSCDTMIVDRDKAVGELLKDGSIRMNEQAEIWKKNFFESRDRIGDLLDECLNCKFLPICVGGCNRSRLMNHANPCFWTEDLIREAMLEYAKAYQ